MLTAPGPNPGPQTGGRSLFPAKGGAPEPPPLPEIEVIVGPGARTGAGWFGYLLAAAIGAGALWSAMALGWMG